MANIFDYIGEQSRHISSEVTKPLLVQILEDLNQFYGSRTFYEDYRYEDLLAQVNASNIDCVPDWVEYISVLSSTLLAKLNSVSAPANYISLVSYIQSVASLRKDIMNLSFKVQTNSLLLSTSVNPKGIPFSEYESFISKYGATAVNQSRFENNAIYNTAEPLS